MAAFGASSAHAATLLPFDADWRFHLGEFAGAEVPRCDDSAWRVLDLPHDWSIESLPSADAPSAGGGGFFLTGVGWYRKTFDAPAAWRGLRVAIEFDGVYRDSEVWLNGHSLGRRPSGFASFRYDLTPFLVLGERNTLAVRVDNSAQPNSRYYTGSGIYRHVRLRLADPLHVEPDSLFVETRALSASVAELSVTAEIVNRSDTARSVSIGISILDATTTPIVAAQTRATVAPNSSSPIRVSLSIPHPDAWSPTSPALHRAVVRILDGERETDRTEATFGLRTIRVSAARGLELNGEPLKLFGGNVHADNGPLGAAAFDRAEERRAELLHAAGFNAVRTAHNPPSPAFLAACDRLGLLVIDEAFDGWKKKKLPEDYGRTFDTESPRDLDAMVRRDRNHPSLVLWSVGNEPYERASPAGAAIAHALADRVRALDPTRPVTAGINGVGKRGDWRQLDPLFTAFDVAGYNYELTRAAADHERVPARVIVSTESYQADAFASWSAVDSAPWVIGDFVWSAMDYLGEAGIGRVFAPGEPVRGHWEGSHFPWHGAACGDLDLIGSRRPLSHYRAIVWNRGERLYAAVRVPTPDGRPWGISLWAPPPLRADWTWPGCDGRQLMVEVYSRHAIVRLYLNDRLIGEKPTTRAEQFKAEFAVPYSPGELRAVGVDGGRETESFVLATAGAPAALTLVADRTALHADGQDLAFANVELTDPHGRLVRGADVVVRYELTGPADFAAIGNADLTSTESYQANPHRTFEGRALVVVRTRRGQPGRIVLTATGDHLPATRIELPATSP